MRDLTNSRQVKTARAFSFIELLVCVMIIGALAAIAVPRIGISAYEPKVTTCDANVKLINNQIELFHVRNGKYPLVYLVFRQNKDYFPDGPPECPFGDVYLMNFSLKRIRPHNH